MNIELSPIYTQKLKVLANRTNLTEEEIVLGAVQDSLDIAVDTSYEGWVKYLTQVKGLSENVAKEQAILNESRLWVVPEK